MAHRLHRSSVLQRTVRYTRVHVRRHVPFFVYTLGTFAAITWVMWTMTRVI